jgi:hypothetical protein
VANARQVLDAFQGGCLAALGAPEAITGAAAAIPWHRREFFWEGVGFGHAALHATSFSRGNPDRRRVTDRYRPMLLTGYGFWEGLARAYALPRLSLDPERWRDLPDFRRSGPFIAGGVGFGVTSGRRAFDDRTLARLEMPDLPGWREAAIHGCGRALWFIYPESPPEIERLLDRYPQHAALLVEGVGMAIGFTQLAAPDWTERTIARFSPAYRPALTLSAAVPLAESEEQAELRERVHPSLPTDLRRALEACREAGRRADQEQERWFTTFCAELRRLGTR